MSKIRLIIWREFITRVRKPSFLIMTVLGPLLIGGGVVLLMYLGLRETTTHQVLVIDEEGVIGTPLKGNEHLTFMIDGHDWSDSAFKAAPFTVKLKLLPDVLNDPRADLFYKQLPSEFIQVRIRNELEKALELAKLRDAGIDEESYRRVRKPLDIQKFDIERSGAQSVMQERAAVGFGFGYIMFFFVFLYGVQVMRGVMEEKQNRIVEVLISSVKPFQLMMGKIIGIAMVGLTQFLLWVVLSALLLSGGSALLLRGQVAELQKEMQEQSGGQLPVRIGGADAQLGAVAKLMDDQKAAQVLTEVLADLPLILLLFLFYFITGYLFISALFAAIGSAVDNETDTQQFMLPITIPTIFAVFIAQMAIYNPTSPMVFWGSMIPFTSPIVMMVRVAMGDAFEHPGELALSMALMVGGFLFTTWLAGRIYRTGILMYGKKVTWRELGKWLFYRG
jgi:ABC-2 type transport system permease protein